MGVEQRRPFAVVGGIRAKAVPRNTELRACQCAGNSRRNATCRDLLLILKCQDPSITCSVGILICVRPARHSRPGRISHSLHQMSSCQQKKFNGIRGRKQPLGAYADNESLIPLLTSDGSNSAKCRGIGALQRCQPEEALIHAPSVCLTA